VVTQRINIMIYLTSPEDAAVQACVDRDEWLSGITQHRKVSVLRDLLRSGERKAFDMVHITVSEVTTVYAALEVASRFAGQSDVNVAGSPPETEGFLRADRSGLFHPNSESMETNAKQLRETLDEAVHAMIASGVNIGQSIEQGSMSGGATVVTRGSVSDYFNLYNQMHPTVHPYVINFATDAWSNLCAAYPAMTQALKEGAVA
jgi:hypothetical protein